MTLTWIVLASLAGGLLSVGAAAFALILRASWVPTLVSFAFLTDGVSTVVPVGEEVSEMEDDGDDSDSD